MMDGIGVGDSFALAIAFSVVVGVGWTWIKKRRQPDTAGALLALSARLDEERRRDRERKAAARDSVDDLGARDLEAAIQDARDFEKSGAGQNAGLEGDGDEEEIDLKDLDAETAELEMFAAAGRDGSG